MKTATHTLKIVEPLYMPDLLKAALQKKDVEKSFVTVVLNESTVAHIHEALSNDYDNCKDFKGCLRIAETCKDLHFNELVGDIIKHLETEYPEEYQNYKKGSESDTSSADGSGER